MRTPECTLKEVSLTDALLHAHEYAGLAGELPTQDVAVLRLLLAVLQTVFYRVDPEGNPSPLGRRGRGYRPLGPAVAEKTAARKTHLGVLGGLAGPVLAVSPREAFFIRWQRLKMELSLERRSSMARFHKAKIKCGYFPVIPGLKKII